MRTTYPGVGNAQPCPWEMKNGLARSGQPYGSAPLFLSCIRSDMVGFVQWWHGVGGGGAKIQVRAMNELYRDLLSHIYLLYTLGIHTLDYCIHTHTHHLHTDTHTQTRAYTPTPPPPHTTRGHTLTPDTH